MGKPDARAPTSTRRRADAERSVARILDAAVEALASDPEVSMTEIARQAGVVRATVYVHFPTREALLEAVTEHAIAHVTETIATAEPHRGDAAEALARVVAEAWHTLGRYHALVAINTRLPQQELHARHRPVLDLLEPLIERGRREGLFASDVPAQWHLAMILAIIHAASAQLSSGQLGEDAILPALTATVLRAVGAPAAPS